MPLYEYECKKCGGVFEVLQKVSDAAPAVHEHCGGSVERRISPPAFHFKGSGWYVTDYAGKSAKSKDRDKDKAAETASKDTKSDSKSDKAKSADKPAPATTKT